jgi:hypothetical protein
MNYTQDNFESGFLKQSTVIHYSTKYMSSGASFQLLTGEARVRSQESPCGIYDGQSGAGNYGVQDFKILFIL